MNLLSPNKKLKKLIYIIAGKHINYNKHINVLRVFINNTVINIQLYLKKKMTTKLDQNSTSSLCYIQSLEE